MKATTRLCPIVLLICAARVVCTAQQRYYNNNNAVGYPLGYAETKLIQNEYFPEKRNKPSLSIVNPLDVLRQRLLLEIARRQMKENTRQVELNRAIMKNVGKRTRTNGEHYNYKFPTQTQQQQQQQQWEYLLTHTPHGQYQKAYTFNTPQQLQKQQQQLLQLELQEQLSPQQQPNHYVNQLEYIPDVSDYDYPQQPLYVIDIGGMAAAAAGGSESGQPETIKHTSSYINALENLADYGDLNTYKANENEMLSETTNENNKKSNSNSATERQNHGPNEAGSTNNKNSPGNEQRLGGLRQELEGNNGNTDSQLRYLYGLHNKRRNM